MSGQKRNDSFNLKHRLTGAAILIGFAVLVLPMLLGGPPDTGSGQSSGDGDTETRVFRSNITPIGGATPNAQRAGDSTEAKAASREDDVGDESTETRTASAGPTEQPAEEPAQPEPAGQAGASGEDDSDEPKTASADTGQSVDRGWIVQVGTFKNPANVDKLVAQLKNSGFGTSTSEVETSAGSATRVWVGPYETRVEAARIKTRIKQKTGSEGLIVAYP